MGSWVLSIPVQERTPACPREFDDTHGVHQEAVQGAWQKEYDEMPRCSLGILTACYRDSGLGSCGRHGLHVNPFRLCGANKEDSRNFVLRVLVEKEYSPPPFPSPLEWHLLNTPSIFSI